ncbi:MerR family transcriptional regulator [Desulfovibrio sp. OttesenSCG-928-F07]|nr:MerR family transcriptional regulator [Desulfovibrio sp. OttesenSCG-928-F07]
MYTITQVAKKFGITAHTLRYYDKEGLLPFVERSAAGTRKFKEADLEWLIIINCLKETGMQIKDIKVFIDWCMQGDGTIQQRYDMFVAQKEKLQQQMEAMQTHMKKIEYKIWYYKTALEAGTVKIHESCAAKSKKLL